MLPLVPDRIGDRLRLVVQRLHVWRRLAEEDPIAWVFAGFSIGDDAHAVVVDVVGVVWIEEKRNFEQLPALAPGLGAFLIFPFRPRNVEVVRIDQTPSCSHFILL